MSADGASAGAWPCTLHPAPCGISASSAPAGTRPGEQGAAPARPHRLTPEGPTAPYRPTNGPPPSVRPEGSSAPDGPTTGSGHPDGSTGLTEKVSRCSRRAGQRFRSPRQADAADGKGVPLLPTGQRVLLLTTGRQRGPATPNRLTGKGVPLFPKGRPGSRAPEGRRDGPRQRDLPRAAAARRAGETVGGWSGRSQVGGALGAGPGGQALVRGQGPQGRGLERGARSGWAGPGGQRS